MKNSAQYAKKVGTLLRKLSPGKPKKEPDSHDPIGMLVYAGLVFAFDRKSMADVLLFINNRQAADLAEPPDET